MNSSGWMQKGLDRRGNSGFGFGSLERTGIPPISVGGILLFVMVRGSRVRLFPKQYQKLQNRY